MKATAWEFRHRSLLMGAVFFVAFAISQASRPVLAVWLAEQVNGSAPHAGAVRIVLAGGTLIAALAAAIRTWGTAYLGASVVFDRDVHAERIVADGPYRYVRNPLYLGTLLLGGSIGLLTTPVGFAVLVFGLSLFLHRLAGREEGLLVEHQGEAFRRYRDAVPRLVPSLRPRVEGGDAAPDWRRAWQVESPMWCMAAALGTLTATLSIYPFWALLGLGLALLVFVPRRATRGGSSSGAAVPPGS